MSAICRQLHEILHALPSVRWPFSAEQLPRNGIYFLFEAGEIWGHGGAHPRIVRVGTHREGNFRSRMADHFLFSNRKTALSADRAAPKDRSIFRKNIGRALLHAARDPYEEIWNVDFTTRAKREAHSHRRDVAKEGELENEVTRILRESFAFAWIEIEGQEKRMGIHCLEAPLIGTLAGCRLCQASPQWLGLSSPKAKIASGGLWLEQHLRAPPLTTEAIDELVASTA